MLDIGGSHGYYSVMLCDLNTFNYGYIGTRATGPAPGDYLIAGPDWKGDMPAGMAGWKLAKRGRKKTVAAAIPA